jgi:hypothetical protein
MKPPRREGHLEMRFFRKIYGNIEPKLRGESWKETRTGFRRAIRRSLQARFLPQRFSSPSLRRSTRSKLLVKPMFEVEIEGEE